MTPAPEVAHVVDQYLTVVAALGIDLDAVGPPVFPISRDASAEARMARWLEEEGVKPTSPLVLLNPGSGGDHKRWALEAFRRLGEELAVRVEARGWPSPGGRGRSRARAIAHGMRTGALVPPPTSITEMIALFRRASLVVGGDTVRCTWRRCSAPDGGAVRSDERAAERALRSPGGGAPEPDQPDGCRVRRDRARRGAGAPPLRPGTGWRACRRRSWC